MALKLDDASRTRLAAAYEKLKAIRTSTTTELAPTPMLRSEIEDLEGNKAPFKLRYYQHQGVYHLLLMPRMVLGDDTGLGKTLEALAALCYLWQKESNRAIVITPKAAILQWASEIEKFTTGVKVFIANGSLDQREHTYRKWAACPTADKPLLIVNYALLVRDWNQGAAIDTSVKPPKVTPGLLNEIVNETSGSIVTTFDECFEYHIPVTLSDGSTRLIGKIVCGKEPVSVLSWNWDSQTFEPRPVIRWLRKPLSRGGLVKVSFKYANSLVATKSHQLYRLDGKATRITDLKQGHETACFSNIIPSEDQLQVILGGLLGDASVSMPNRTRWGVQFVQGEAQLRYLQFKRAILTTLGVSTLSKSASGYGGSPIYRFRLNSNPYLCSLLTTHEGGKKKPSLDWLDLITPLGLAVWYADDGAIQTRIDAKGERRNIIVLNTQGFSRADNELLAGWLRWKWGVYARVSTSAGRSTLYLNHAAATRFLDLLPGGFPSVMYKFPGKPELTMDRLSTEPRVGLVRDTITSIVPWRKAQKDRAHIDYVYDLEVEGNHNYIANGTLVSNCTAFKNTSTKTFEVCQQLSEKSTRCYGLTATLLKNNLMEGFSIFKVICPWLFATKTRFMDEYCVTKLQPVAGGRKIPIVVGYKRLDQFRAVIDPYFLGRKKYDVSSELPTIVTKEVLCEMSPGETAKYHEALSGVLELGDGELKDYEEHKALVALNYCQQVVNSLTMLKFNDGDDILSGIFHEESHTAGPGAKEQALIDLLTTELEDEKVIIYTKYESLVQRLVELLSKEKIKSVRITGRESDTERKANQDDFQNPKSKTRVIFITNAGSEAINLQTASALVFYDSPWSWGTYLQILGRMIRIGSKHSEVVAYHMVAERPASNKVDRRTIDHHVLAILREKKTVIEKVLGASAVGALEFDAPESATKDLFKRMRAKK